jgi:hypothetical protein
MTLMDLITNEIFSIILKINLKDAKNNPELSTTFIQKYVLKF